MLSHRVNAVKHAIQTFKDHFINSKFPLQLWNRLTSQVETTLNLMQASRINPNILAYEAIWGPYNWNRFPLAPPVCKAVIYESSAARGSWGSRGMDAWYLGPSLDHYQYNHYFVPETRAYRISRSALLFPQHCQVPFLSTSDYMQELMNKVVSTFKTMTPEEQQRVLMLFQAKLADTAVRPEGPAFLLSPCHVWILPEEDIQRVPQLRTPTQDQQRVAPSAEQRMGTTHDITAIQDLR